MQSAATFRTTIERMEEHEIIDRLSKGMFSEDAQPIAEAILRDRGIDPTNPQLPRGQDSTPSPAEPKKPVLLPLLFGVLAASAAGRQIGAALAGAVGAGLVSAALIFFGWWAGRWVATASRQLELKLVRLLVAVAALLVWAFAWGMLGVLVQIVVGRTGALGS